MALRDSRHHPPIAQAAKCPARRQSLLEKGREVGPSRCLLPSSAGEAPGEQDNSTGPKGGHRYLAPGSRAKARLTRPSSFPLLASKDSRGQRCARGGDRSSSPGGLPAPPGVCRRVLPARPTSGPRVYGAEPGLTCTARVKKMPASDASFFMLKSMARPHGRRVRPERSREPPAQPPPPAPRPPAAGYRPSAHPPARSSL
ncbi:hypothetical protein AAY473_023065 [Plecturocebus cupreus]